MSNKHMAGSVPGDEPANDFSRAIECAISRSRFAHCANREMIYLHALHGVRDAHSRLERVRPFLAQPMAALRVLDMGCGSGAASVAMREMGLRQVVSFDLQRDPLGIDLAVERGRLSGQPLALLLANGYHLPFPDDHFDLCWCEFVVEHVADLDRLLCEARRVLRPNGLMYIATNNKWWPKEGHTMLWWVGWMPRGVAERYARARHHWPADQEWDIYLYSRRQLHSRFAGTGWQIVATTANFVTGTTRRVAERFGLVRVPLFEMLLPNHYVLVRKSE